MTTSVAQASFPHSLSVLGRTLLLLLCGSLAAPRAWADDRAALRLFTQDFYKAYAAAENPDKFVAKSDKITPGFKKAYTAFLKKQQGFDPIIQGQDVPSSGYQAGEVELASDTKATVTMTTKEKGFSTLKVHVIWNGSNWLLNGVNDLKGK